MADQPEFIIIETGNISFKLKGDDPVTRRIALDIAGDRGQSWGDAWQFAPGELFRRGYGAVAGPGEEYEGRHVLPVLSMRRSGTGRLQVRLETHDGPVVKLKTLRALFEGQEIAELTYPGQAAPALAGAKTEYDDPYWAS
jgi:hypothetical protein